MIVRGTLAFAPELSATWTVKFEVPAVDGVPATPPELFSESPAGSVPALTVQLYGAVPPFAVKVCEYAVPTIPLGSAEVVIVKPAPIMIVRGTLAFAPELSATWTVKFEVPAVDGVPATPPELFSESPAGSVPALTVQLYGAVPPFAVKVCEYAVPTIPLGSAEVVIVKPAPITIVRGTLAFAPELSAT